MNHKTQSVCVVDNGIFSEVAVALARSFGKVWYTSPWVSGFPSSGQLEIGEGMIEIERVDDLYSVIEDCDLFVFPDIYQSAAQIYLVSIGKRVWGSREGDDLEIYRKDAKLHFKEMGIPQANYESIDGVDALREYIKSHDEKLWIKGNKARGDFETFAVENYQLGQSKIDDIQARLGPKAEEMNVIVEKNLKDSLDIAIDTYCIDGNYPNTAVIGTEEKGECYVGEVGSWDQMPVALRDIYTRLRATLQSYEYRNFLSLESRVLGDKIYLGDPCCRGGSPPLELQLNWMTNLADVMWEGAGGNMVEPKYNGRFGVELIIHSDWACSHPLMVDFPEKYRDKIKFRYNTEFKGKTWIMPQNAGPRMAAIVATGDSVDACMEECKEISGELRGIQIEAFTRAFPIITEKIEKLKGWGSWLQAT